MLIILFLSFIFGLIIGSFLNVVVFRLKEEKTILGRSFCPKCKKQIRFYDNIPVLSFIYLRGKCRDCHEKISWQYPTVEFLTGALFALSTYYFFPVSAHWTSWITLAWILGITSLFIVIGTYDFLYMEIPISLLIGGAVWTFLFLSLASLEQGVSLGNRLGLGLAGGIAVTLFFFSLVYASREQWMGWGDVWLGGLAGMIVGLPLILFMLTLSFGIGALISIGMLLWSDKKMKSQIPFAPFLISGVILSLFLPVIFPFFMQIFFL